MLTVLAFLVGMAVSAVLVLRVAPDRDGPPPTERERTGPAEVPSREGSDGLALDGLDGAEQAPADRVRAGATMVVLLVGLGLVVAVAVAVAVVFVARALETTVAT